MNNNMNSLKSALSHIELPEHLKDHDIWEAIRADEEAMTFIRENKENGKLTDAAILRGNARLHEFVTQKGKSTTVEPKLIVNYGDIEIAYMPKNKRIQKIIQEGGTKFTYDDATKEYKGLTMDDYKVTGSNQEAVSYIAKFIKDYEDNSNIPGMWLNGYFGVGKTYLMACFTGELKEHLISFSFIDINRWLDSLRAAMNYKGTESDDLLNATAESKVLIIDDLGSERMTDWVFDKLSTLFDYRMKNDLPTFVTTNLTKDEYMDSIRKSPKVTVDQKDADRVRERIDYLTKSIEMTGKNKRRKADNND